MIKFRCNDENRWRKISKRRYKNIKVAVIGDIMLDRYISGNVERISPEAPVPINLVKSQRNVLGGAANTAANLSSLGGQVFIAGMRGNDRDGDTLSELLRAAGIDDTGVIVSEEYSTTTKVRILGARQQMMRLDLKKGVILMIKYANIF